MHMMRTVPALLLACVVLALGACAQPQSTRMTGEDFIAMSEEMSQSLMRADALARRGPDSERWVISIERVRNLSSDIMTRAEQWAIIARLRGTLPLQELERDKNIVFVLPPERVRELRASDEHIELDERFGAQRPEPTHTMSATFRSITRAQERSRVDVYFCEFEIIDLRTGEPIWTDRFEYQRRARGRLRN